MRMSTVKTITGSELVPLLRATPRSVTIVDVRDDDFLGGHIKGALHIPRDTFKYSIDEQVKNLGTSEHVVFHCMMSQVRGPYCANLFATRCAAAKAGPVPKVSVLEGGFGSFVREFWNEKDLFSSLDTQLWNPNAPRLY